MERKNKIGFLISFIVVIITVLMHLFIGNQNRVYAYTPDVYEVTAPGNITVGGSVSYTFKSIGKADYYWDAIEPFTFQHTSDASLTKTSSGTVQGWTSAQACVLFKDYKSWQSYDCTLTLTYVGGGEGTQTYNINNKRGVIGAYRVHNVSCDDYGGNCSNSWSTPVVFYAPNVGGIPNVPGITAYSDNQKINDNTPTFSWNYSHPDNFSQKKYQVVGSRDEWATWHYNSGELESGVTSHTASLLTEGEWDFAIRVSDGNNWSDWSYRSNILIDITGPSIPVFTPNERWLNTTTFRLEVFNPVDAQSGIMRVVFPTWTDAGGQDDIIYYEGTNAGGGHWYADVPISNHGNQTGKYVTHIYVYDGAGNYNAVVVNTNIDRTNPSGTLYADSSFWTKNNVIISVTGADYQSGLKRVKLPDGTYTTASSSTYTITSNGTYPFVFEDNVGNTYLNTITVSNIDKINPIGALTQSPSGTKTSGRVAITAVGTDAGGSSFKYIKNPSGVIINSDSTSFDVSTNGTYVFEFGDYAGNVSIVPITVLNINENIPVITLNGLMDSAIRKPFVFNLHTNDADAVDTITYTLAAGSAPGQTNYNAYLSSTVGINKGDKSIFFDLDNFLASELIWNSSNFRYEKVIYLTGSVTDGYDTVNINYEFVVFNNRPASKLDVLADVIGYRTITNELNLLDMFSDPDGHKLNFSAISSDSLIAKSSVSANKLSIVPIKVGETTINVTTTDGLGGSLTKTFTFIVDNQPPGLTITDVKVH